jgi:indolepyruvate ferredoxin oxidoreductase
MSFDGRFTQNVGTQVFTGAELLVKGALEADGGVHLFTGCPAAPVADYFSTLTALATLLEAQGQVATVAGNEAQAVAMGHGAQWAGCRAIVALGNAKLAAAGEALSAAILAGGGEGGAALLVCGDDPWNHTTALATEARHVAQSLRLPMLEPASPQELKDWIDVGIRLSAAAQTPVGYLLPVTLAHGGGTVHCRHNQPPKVHQQQKRALSFARDVEPTLFRGVPAAGRAAWREQMLEQRFALLRQTATKLGINRVLHRPQKDEVVPLGFVASGTSYACLVQALAELGALGPLPILKLGLSYPLDEQVVLDFASQCRQLIVVEPRRAFLESQIVALLHARMQRGERTAAVYGKQFPGGLAGVPEAGGLTPSSLMERLIPLLRQHPSLPREAMEARFVAEELRITTTNQSTAQAPPRPPTFCPGCPHRDSASVLLDLRRDLLEPQYMLHKHKRQPIDLLFHGDAGCSSLLAHEPFRTLMQSYSGTGQAGVAAGAASQFIQNKQVVFMGDTTFFHGGQLAIEQAIKQNHDVMFVLLDNHGSGGTSQQTHAGAQGDLMGRLAPGQDIGRLIAAMTPKPLRKRVHVVAIDPSDRSRLRNLLEQTVLEEGVKVIVADKACGILTQRQHDRQAAREITAQGYLTRQTVMHVNADVCDMCLECTTRTGCTGLKLVDTDYGPKVQTDPTWCVNDGACQRLDACPSFEQVTILRGQLPRSPWPTHVATLPEPPTPIHANQETWRCCLAGVGGMGVAAARQVLAAAGQAMGYHVQFIEHRGIAVRTGSVFAQLVYTRQPVSETEVTGPDAPRLQACVTTPLTPSGKADLLLGIDALEAVRAIDPRHPYRFAAPDRTAAVINTALHATVPMLMGQDDFDPQRLLATLREHTSDQFLAHDLSHLSERLLGSRKYVNILLLGVALQRGLLPVKRAALEEAVKRVLPADSANNLRALTIGRQLVAQPEALGLVEARPVRTARQALRRALGEIRQRWPGRRGRRLAREFLTTLQRWRRADSQRRLPDAIARDIVVRAADCLRWGGMPYVQRYGQRIVQTFSRDDERFGFALTAAVAVGLAHVMLIKDEVYVAALLTDPRKVQRDRIRFDADPRRGDILTYTHFLVPHIEWLGKPIRWHWKARPWQLRIIRRLGVLRRWRGWHRREVEFRAWYEELVDRLAYQGPRDYQRWVAILSTVHAVSGFSDVRYARMAAARRRADQLLTTDPDLFEPPSAPKRLSLPVLT